MSDNSSPSVREKTIQEKIQLSPIEKFVKYGRFPYKLIIHILLIVFTTVQLLQLADTASTYKKPIMDNSTNPSFSTNFYTLKNFQEHLQSLTYIFDHFNDNVFNTIDTDGASYHIQVYYNDFEELKTRTNFVYPVNISQGITSPFNVSDIRSLKSFVQRVTKLNFNATNIKSISVLNDDEPSLCFNWTISLQYKFTALSHIDALLVMDSTECKEDTSPESIKETILLDEADDSEFKPVFRRVKPTYSEGPFGLNFWILNTIVMVLAAISLYLAWHYIFQMGVMYMHARQNKNLRLLRKGAESNANANGDFEVPWQELSLVEKSKFFNISLVVIIIGNCAQILGSAVALSETLVPPSMIDFTMFNTKISLIGFGCMCAWMMIIYYLDYNKSFQSTTDIIKSSSVGFIKFIVGVIPVYMAFVFLGRCLFWKYSKFETTNQAVISLFSIIAGDIIDETYTDVSGEGIISGVYLTAFIILFMGAVHNVIISIVSDGFRNKFLEERYQKLFSLYALGQGPSSEEMEGANAPMSHQQYPNEITKRKADPLSSLIPYLSQNLEMTLDDTFREKMEMIEAERNRILFLLNEKTQEIESVLERMKELVNYFLEEVQNRDAKKKVKATYIKYLMTINYYIKKEIKEKLQFKSTIIADQELSTNQNDTLVSSTLRRNRQSHIEEEEEEEKAQ